MIPIVMLAGVLIFFGLFPSPLIDLIHSGAMSLMGKISDIGMIMGGF
jgi:NADH-quinone oxidoreductase subunit M